MQYFGTILGFSWSIFCIIWLVSAFTAKRNRRVPWWRSAWLRIIIAAGVFLIFQQQIDASFSNVHGLSPANLTVGVIGIILTIIGIAIALWARLYIGTNWGMPMSLKENRELVTSGPYHYIRHPIYAGIALAMIGSALVIGPWLLLVVAIYFIYFIYSAVSEEKTLAEEFPNEYPAYKKRTKMLIPFIL